jgi:hypothetical protein
MEVISSSEISVHIRTTLYYIPEDGITVYTDVVHEFTGIYACSNILNLQKGGDFLTS